MKRAWVAAMSIPSAFLRDQGKLDKLAAQEIRRISRDQRNRLNSIHEDALFVGKVADLYPGYALIGERAVTDGLSSKSY